MEKKELALNLFKKLGAQKENKEELLEYTKNKFDVANAKIPEKIKDEAFILDWEAIIYDAKKIGLETALNENILPEGENIKFIEPENVTLTIYYSIAGNIPILFAKNEEDFYELVRKLILRGRDDSNLKKTGASFAFGKKNKFIILSNKPYSNIPASSLGLDEEKWKDFSSIIRREHECTHYFTKRFLGSSASNLHDELVADFAGIMCAVGKFKSDWFLKGLGLAKCPAEEQGARFIVYTSNLSSKSQEIMKKIITRVSENVEKWSEEEITQNMQRNERILFLCSKSLIDLYYLYQ